MKQNAWKPHTIKENQNYSLIEDQGYPPDLTATYASINWKDSSIVNSNTSANKNENVMQENALQIMRETMWKLHT